MIVREADGTILTHAGPEIGVASTKAFTGQMVALYLLGLYLGQLRGVLSEDEARFHAQELAELPVKLEHLLNDSDWHRGTLERVLPLNGFSLSRTRHQLSRRA